MARPPFNAQFGWSQGSQVESEVQMCKVDGSILVWRGRFSTVSRMCGLVDRHTLWGTAQKCKSGAARCRLIVQLFLRTCARTFCLMVLDDPCWPPIAAHLLPATS
jgi:hypothetical protein